MQQVLTLTLSSLKHTPGIYYYTTLHMNELATDSNINLWMRYPVDSRPATERTLSLPKSICLWTNKETITMATELSEVWQEWLGIKMKGDKLSINWRYVPWNCFEHLGELLLIFIFFLLLDGKGHSSCSSQCMRKRQPSNLGQGTTGKLQEMGTKTWKLG